MSRFPYFVFTVSRFCVGEITSIESVPELQKLMYVAVDGYPCVRLLNLSGEIGCSSKLLLGLPLLIFICR